MSKVIKFPPTNSELIEKAELLKCIIDDLVKRNIDFHLVVDSEERGLEEILRQELPEAKAGNKLYPRVALTTNLEKAQKLINRSFWGEL